jgi:hypothetical protein
MDNSLYAGSAASIRASADLDFLPPVDVTSRSSEDFTTLKILFYTYE